MSVLIDYRKLSIICNENIFSIFGNISLNTMGTELIINILSQYFMFYVK